jgi:hypothetical protein
MLGSLLMNHGESEVIVNDTVLFGTVRGTIGVIAQITKDKYDVLHQIQTCLVEMLPKVGNLCHKE